MRRGEVKLRENICGMYSQGSRAVKGKGKLNLEQVMKGYRGSRGIALLFL
jgi:hypothetical protein